MLERTRTANGIDVKKFTANYKTFKRDILATIGDAFLLGIPMEAIRVMQKHAKVLNVDEGFLFEIGPILASINAKEPEEILSLQAFRLEAWIGGMNRDFTPHEKLLLDLVSKDGIEAGYPRTIRHLSEISGVTIFYPDGRVVVGGETGPKKLKG